MEETYEYYCQFCSQFTNAEFACPHCGEYKGLVKVGPAQTNEEE